MNNAAQFSIHSLAVAMEAESARFRIQAIECPNDISLWTKLQTVSQIMLAAMREGRVASALEEICSNLLACEQFAIVEVARATGRVQFRKAHCVPSEMSAATAERGKLLESQIALSTPYITTDKSDKSAEELSRMGISVLVPLWSDETSSAAMLLFQLLPQHSGFDTEQREILQFLSTHAGPCLRSPIRG